MKRRVPLVVALGLLAAALVLITGAFGSAGATTHAASTQGVRYSQVQAVFARYGCTGCHPLVNPSLDLRPGRSYANLVGIRALEDPRLYRVVAGDPDRSFLFLKLGGDPALADIPAIGGRMPPGAPPIAAGDLDLIRRWIEQGAKGPNGRTGGPRVVTPGTPPGDLSGTADAARPRGTGTIGGTVVDQRRKPIAGALVTILLRSASQPGGEEHYRVAQTDAAGRFVLAHAPAGRFLLKAYASRSIYVSRIVALEPGKTATIDFGLPDRVLRNPAIAAPSVHGRLLAMTVKGDALDGNYTLAANPRSGTVFELHHEGDRPGRWTRTIPRALPGPWVFLAVDHQCNVSQLITVSR